MYRTALVVGVSLALLAATGCQTTRARTAGVSPKPVASDFELRYADTVADRYLILPIDHDTDKDNAFVSGSLMGAGSSWPGLGFDKSGVTAGNWLNIVIVDAQTGQQRRVFDHHVAVEGWRHSFRPRGDGELRYPNLLILVAYPADTNGNRKIDRRDDCSVFTYDLSAGELKQVSPPGVSVRKLEFVDDAMLLVTDAGGERERSLVSVYRYEPQTQSGRFIAERIAS